MTALPASSGHHDTSTSSDALGRTSRNDRTLPEIAGLGRYIVITQLGHGAMGVVVSAYDPSLDRKVAIKVLLGSIQAGSDGAIRMQREAQAMARVSHPNVAQVFEVGESEGRLYLVMEYIEGATLRHWLAERPRTTHEVLRAFTEAGRGLAAAHAVGVIHRDFKPDNAMLGADGRVRVLDFGLSRSVMASEASASHAGISDAQLTLTADGTLIGTPAYMSPEQHMRRETDARSDQFSFCVALYEALHGQRPYAGTNIHELAKQVVTGTLSDPPPHSRVPAWLRQVVTRGLQPDPAARWPSMHDLLAALGRDPQRTRRRWLAAGLAAVAVAGAGYGAAAYRVAQDQVCSAAAEELRGVWDPARRDALAHVIDATAVTYAPSVRAAVTTRLDAYAERWLATHTAACEAHHRGTGSAQLYDRRMACLQQRRTELAATVDVLMQTTADNVATLLEATMLPPVASCEDDERLLADIPLPADPQLAADVERARARLARLQALERGGRHLEALAELQPELATMQRLGDVALLAEGHLLAGKLRMHRMEGSAREDLDRALELGLEARLDAVAAEALVVEIFQIGYVERRPNDALAFVPLASALVRRVGDPAQLAALLQNNIATMYAELGDFARAAESFQRGLDLFGPDEQDPLRWVLINNLAQTLIIINQSERAYTLAAPALQQIERLYDRCHPVATSLRSILTANNRDAGRFDLAIADYEESIRCFQADSPARAAIAMKNLIYVAILRDDDAAARQYLARADAFADAAPETRPQLTFLRAELELRAGHHDAARELFIAERARLIDSVSPTKPDLAAIAIRMAIFAHLEGDEATALEHIRHATERIPEYWHEERGRLAFTHAQVLQALGHAPAEITALIDDAIHNYRLAGAAFDPRVAAIEAWAATPPRPTKTKPGPLAP